MAEKSRLITFIIYSLLLYIIFILLKPIILDLVAEDDIYRQMKNIAITSIPAAEYVHRVNTEFTSESNSMDSMVMNMLSTPLSSYIQSTAAANVAERPELYYLGDSELTNEKKQTTTDISNVANADNTTENEENTNETGETQTMENETTQELQTEETFNGNTLPSKIKSIDVNQLTFDFLMANYYTVVSSTTITPEDLNASSLMNVELKMQQDNSKPQILIYHTHGMETFVDSNPEDKYTGILGVGNYLTELLTEKYGYNVIHIEDSFDYVNGKLDRNKAYDYAYNKISQVLADNPSIEVVLDIHRDGVDENNHLVTNINGKPTAKIMFFNGISRLSNIGEIDYLYNPYRTQNLAMSLQLKVLAEEYFEGFTRRNYIQAYQYNLHLRPKSMLIEVGAQTNTFEEVKNAMEPLAALLYMKLQ